MRGDSCRITRRGGNCYGGCQAHDPAACPDGFFGTNRRTLGPDNQRELGHFNGTVAARFWPRGLHKWVGLRASDEAKMYLDR